MILICSGIIWLQEIYHNLESSVAVELRKLDNDTTSGCVLSCAEAMWGCIEALQGCYRPSEAVLWGCTEALRGCYRPSEAVLWGCTAALRGCYRPSEAVLWGCTEALRGCYRPSEAVPWGCTEVCLVSCCRANSCGMSRSRLLSVLVSVRPSAAAIHTGSKPSALAALPRPHDAPLPARRRPAPRCSQGSWNAPPAAGGDVIAAASLAGRRPVNEDRYHVRQLNADVLLVGVFDGHGGAAAANYARQHLADIVTAMLRPGCDLEEVLEEAFLALDDGFARSVSQDPEGEWS